ncbi:MAG: hypothetical protein GY781_15220 [Gammaproteobacteria bacterium]|nr:hypothetical protein [Gammaproteobacteria bacterium]
MLDYLRKAERPLTVGKLSPLIGAVFTVNIEGWEWGERIIETDKLVITNISLNVDVESGEETSRTECIYMDFFLNGILQYNAHISFEQLKMYAETVNG